MSRRESFDDALDAAIDALAGGAALNDVLAAHPEHATELLPLLAATAPAFTARPAPEPSPRLAANFRTVRAALHRAEPQPKPAPWWRRPVSFASLSLPAGVFALVAFGGAAAAGGAVAAATTTDLPAKVQHAFTLDFSSPPDAPRVPGSTPTQRTPSGGAPAAVPSEGPAHAGDGGDASAPAAAQRITVSGRVDHLAPPTFRLEADDGEWTVRLTGATAVEDGALAEGAIVTVTGDAVGRTLEAATVELTAPNADTAGRDAGDRTPEPAEHPGGDGDEATPGPADTRGEATRTEQPGDGSSASGTPETHATEQPEPTQTPQH